MYERNYFYFVFFIVIDKEAKLVDIGRTEVVLDHELTDNLFEELKDIESQISLKYPLGCKVIVQNYKFIK